MPEWLKYTGLDTFDDSPRKFQSMLSAMGDGERVQLAQSLRMLPAIRKGDFGNYGLPSLEAVRPGELPETFNEVPQEVVLTAIKMERIPAELISSERIIRELTWVSSSLITYWFKSSDVYYHDLVCWVASKFDVSKDEISGLPTFKLERRILGKSLSVFGRSSLRPSGRIFCGKSRARPGKSFRTLPQWGLCPARKLWIHWEPM